MSKVGYLGPKGTFSHEALGLYLKGREYTAVSCTSIPEMLLSVSGGELDEAIVPIENSIEGAVNATLDMMAADVDLKIKAEYVMAIRENLLVPKGTALEDIDYVLSHPQPIGQCRRFISTCLPNVKIKYVYSTAGAAEEVAASGKGYAAIGSSVSAEEYGLDVLAAGIQDDENNHTRFVLISKDEAGHTGSDKTSIVFSTEDRPGSLYRILDIFNLWDINMTRIESRPAKNQLGRYIFFIDISGHKDDDDIRDALTMVKRKSSFFKFLGSYPAFRV
jgi:prephenate dehydratase